jgi:predicted oxidoreductase
VKTYRIPNTELDVSRLAFGTWHMGGTWDTTPPTPDLVQRADDLLHAAVAHGINLIDLADIYTWGKSDMVVGEALKRTPSLRDKLILQEKTGIILGGELGAGSVGHYDFSYQNITHKLETSLKRLNTDYVDLLLLHRPDPLVQPEEVARAFDDLHASGKVRYFGVSNHTPMQIELLKKYVRQPLVVNQVELNLLHNDLINDGIVANTHRARYTGARDTLDYCRLHDMLVQAWSPVAGGQLFVERDDTPEHVRQTVRLIAHMAEQHQTTREAIALAWLLHHPAPIQPILGTLSVQRMADSVKADDVTLSRLEWYTLLATANGTNVP